MPVDDGAAVASTSAARGSRSILGVAFLTMFLDLLGFGIIIPVQPFYAESFGASPAGVTLIGMAYSLMQFLCAPLWGRLSDRIGRRPVVLVSIAFAVLGFCVFGLAHSLWVLVLARLIAGFGNANLGTVQAIIADVTPPEQRAKAMGVLGAAFGLGFVFGPAVGGVVGASYGPQAPAFLAAGLALLNGVLAFVLLPETRAEGAHVEHRHGFAGLFALHVAQRHLNVRALLALVLLFTCGFAMMESALSLFVEHAFVAPESIGTAHGQREATRLATWVFLAVGITAVIVQGALIGLLRKLASERTLIIVGCACIAASLAALPFAPALGGYALMFPLVVLLSFGSGVFAPSQSALLSRSVPSGDQGAILGLGQSMSALGRIFGAGLAGTLFELARGAPFLTGATLIACAGVLAVSLRTPASP